MKQVEQLDISYSTNKSRCSVLPVFANRRNCLSNIGKRIMTFCMMII